MLNISDFGISQNILCYFGVNHYFITSGKTGYILTVATLDEDGDARTETYNCSSVSSAIATIEEMEA